MALGVCIPDLIAQGKIKGERAARAQQLYDELLLQYERRFGRGAAESMATKATVDALEREMVTRQRQSLLQAQAQARIEKQAREVFDGGTGTGGPINGEAMLAHLVRDHRARGIANVEFRAARIADVARRQMYGAIDKYAPGWRSEIRNKAEVDDVVRELWGDATGNANAREIADAWKTAGEYLRRRFNSAGGNIAKLDGWALPQHHDAALVGAASREQWIEYVAPRLDRAKMIDDATGEPMSDARLTEMLSGIYDSIRTNGWNNRSPTAAYGTSIGNRHMQHRVLHFSSADDWLDYQEVFGGTNAYEAMMAHIDRMARDTAMIEILGPNPSATIKWMQGMVTKDAETLGDENAVAAATKWANRIDQVWREVSGDNLRIDSRGLALFGSTLRHHQVSTKLGSAVISAFSDHATAAVTRAYNGLPVMASVKGYFSNLNPLDKEDRAFARRWLVMNDELVGRSAGAGRQHMEEMFGLTPHGRTGLKGKALSGLESAQAFSSRWSNRVMWWSGLNAHTVTLREGVHSDFWNAFTTHRARDFDLLPQGLQRFFSNYGMGRADWDKLRATPLHQHKNSEWILADRISDEALADRVSEAIMQEVVYAVPTGGLYARARVNSAGIRGDLAAEFVKTGFQFKMFPMMVVGMHYQRMMSLNNLSSRAAYATSYLGAMIAFGVVSYQVGEIARGRDPRPMTDREFWWRAMLKSGGLGIYGDALELSKSEFGRSVGNLAVGPAWGTVQTLFEGGQAAFNSATASTEEEQQAAGRERSRAIRNLSREVPGNNLWYIRAAYERLLIDTINGWADPDYGESIRRMEGRAAETGQAYFLPPGGGMADARAPNLGNAFADAPE